MFGNFFTEKVLEIQRLTTMSKGRVLMAMSGGIDSTMASLIFMKKAMRL